jgi:hypothetical protein
MSEYRVMQVAPKQFQVQYGHGSSWNNIERGVQLADGLGTFEMPVMFRSARRVFRWIDRELEKKKQEKLRLEFLEANYPREVTRKRGVKE